MSQRSLDRFLFSYFIHFYCITTSVNQWPVGEGKCYRQNSASRYTLFSLCFQTDVGAGGEYNYNGEYDYGTAVDGSPPETPTDTTGPGPVNIPE